MRRRLLAARLAILALGACAPLCTGCGATTAPQSDAEVLLLLNADGPLAITPAPEHPSPELAEGELILNSQDVPELVLQGVLYERLLYADPETQRRYSIVRWPADVTLPRHYHASTERVYMLEGSIASADDGEIGPGVFWEAPAGVAMGPFTSERGGTFIFLGEGPFDTVLLEPGEQPPDPGLTLVVDPNAAPWQPVAELVRGAAGAGTVRIVRPGNATDRAVYLLRPGAAPGGGYAVASANIEGYVLRGELELADPYHGTHVLGEGHFFRIPAGLPTSLFGPGSGT